jgi:hypothetical protein
MFTGQKKAATAAWTLPQYCQLPDKNFRDTYGDIWNFLRYFKIYLFIYSITSRGTRNDVLRNPGWETMP